MISRKLVPGDATQLIGRTLCKANESQSAWGSRINLKLQNQKQRITDH